MRLHISLAHKLGWAFSSAAVGALFGVQAAAPKCLKDLLVLTPSPLADEARRLVIARAAYLPNSQTYLRLLSTNQLDRSWGDENCHNGTKTEDIVLTAQQAELERHSLTGANFEDHEIDRAAATNREGFFSVDSFIRSQAHAAERREAAITSAKSQLERQS
mmetsp:Transcript_79359/g.212777  ORF Transcript_79359/g.212777 Transcript_79359/m.212777 type:complete len:161 (-) Transcript_79359:26-508(-)